MNHLETRTEFVDRYGLYHLVGDSADADAEDEDVANEMRDWMISRLAGVSEAISNQGKFAYEDIGAESLNVAAAATPDMTVTVHEGACFIALSEDSIVAVRLKDDTVLAVGGVTTLPRIDLVTIDTDGMLHVLPGEVDAAPEAPDAPSGQLALATVTHAVGETSIKDADDGSNGYITNVASFCNL